MTGLLIVEDNADLSDMLSQRLECEDYMVDVAATLADAKEMLAQCRYDAVLLDIGLPDGNGLTLLRSLRAQNNVCPVMILSERGGVADRVRGLESGADDYLVKPFAFEELLARLRALLRRPSHYIGKQIRVGNLTLDTGAKQVFINGKPQIFTAREASMLELLMRRTGCVVAKQTVEGQLYGLIEDIRSNAVEVCVHRLRKRLTDLDASVGIRTIRGIGYILHEESV